MKSDLEELFQRQLEEAKITGWCREYRFHPTRKWRFDFAWPHDNDFHCPECGQVYWKLAVEIQGGVHIRGRHARGVGIEADNEKANAAAFLGWIVFRYTGKSIKNGQAIKEVAAYVANPAMH